MRWKLKKYLEGLLGDLWFSLLHWDKLLRRVIVRFAISSFISSVTDYGTFFWVFFTN